MTTENVIENVEAVESVEVEEGVDPGEAVGNEAEVEDFATWLARKNGTEEKKEQKVEPKAEKKEEEGNTEEKKETKEEPKTVKYKVDGEEVEVDLKDVPTLLAKAAGADKRFQEAAQIRKEATEFVQYLKKSPIEALKRAGVDFEQLAIDHVHELIRLEQMTPEQKEAYQLRKENETFKQKEAREKEEREAREKAELEEIQRQETEKAIESYERDIISVFEANPELPKNRFVVSRFAYYLEKALEQGYDLKAQDVLPYVRQELAGMIKEEKQAKVQEAKAKIDNPKVPGGQAGKKGKPEGKRITSLQGLLDAL